MADIIKLLLQAKIEDSSITNIQSQINEIQAKAKPVEIKVDTSKGTQNIKNITSSFEKLEEVTKKNLSLDLDRLSNRYKNLVKSSDIAQVRAMIDTLKYDDPKLGHNIDLIKVKMKEMSVGAEQSRKSLDLANKSAMSFGESIKTAASKFLIWSGVTVAYYGFVRAVKSGIITVKDLDTAMVELKKVTDETEETYNKFTETAFKLGKELSRTGIEVVQATSDFARMGYDIKQAAELAYEALLMTNVGDGIDNIDEATSSIIATLKGFRIEGEETATAARHINDAFNEVANNFAVDTGSLAEGIKRTSAVLNQAGNSFEESIGMLTGAYEVIQNMPKASSGINIITQRLKAMDEEGNKIEGLAPKLEKAFNDIGLSLYNADGELKSTYENLSALAKVFPRLTKEQQNYISELTSGKRQSTVLMSLMSNWESVEKAVISATNSTGSAMAENEKYLNSIEGKVANFTSTVQMFWNTAINSDAIKNIVDFGTSLMEHLIDLTNKFGIFGNALGIIIPLIGIKYVLAVTNATKATIQQKLTSDLLGNSTISLLNGFKLLIGQLFGVKTAADGAKISFLGLNAAAGIISVTLAAIPMIIGAIATAEDKRKRALEESIEAFKKQQEISTNTNDLISSYEELANKTKLTIEEQEKLFAIKEKIKELLPESKTYLDNENLSLKEQVKIVKELNKKELERLEIEAHKQVSRGSRAYEDEKKELEKLIKLLEEWKKKQKELSQKFFDKSISQDELSIYKEISEKTPELQKKIDKLTDSTEAYESAVDFLTNGIQDNTDTVDENTDATDKNNDSINSQLKSISDLYKKVSIAVDEYDLFNQALKELNEEGRISKSTYEKLIEVNEEFISIMGLEKDVAISLITAHKDKRRAIVTALIEEQNQVITSTEAKIAAHEAELMMLDELLKKRNQLAYLDEREGLVFEEGGLGQNSGIIDTTQAVGNWKKAIENARDKIASLKGWGGLFDASDSKDKSKSSSSAKDQYKAEADRYAKINLELDKNNILLQKNKTLQDLAGNDLAKKISLMEEEIRLNKQRQKSLNDLNNERRKEVKELEKSLSKQGFKFSGTGDNRMITNLNNIKGKTKEVETQFNRYMQLQKTEIPQASQEWWNLQSSIEKVKLDKSVSEFELADQQVNKLQKSLSQLEYQFKLLEDTDLEGKADNIAKQIAILKKEVKLAEDELEQMGEVGEDSLQVVKDRQEELNKRIQDGTLAIDALEKSLVDLRETARQNWIAEKNALYKDQQDRLQALDRIQEAVVAIIRKRGEAEKKALDEAHKAEMNSLEERHKERKKKYQEDLDEFKRLIQGKIDALDEQWEEEDYLEQLNKEREEANRLQREIDVLSLDDSLTARNKVIELRKQLADQNEKIAKMQQKKERDLLKKSLQDQLKQHEKDAKDKEDIADSLYENEKKRLEEDYQINKEFLERKYSDEQVYAEARESIMRGQVEVAEGVFRDIYDAYVDFENKFGRGMGILGDIIRDDFIRQLEDARDAIRQLDYMASNRLPEYDSGYQPRDDEWDYRDPIREDDKDDYKEDGKLSSMSKQDYEKYVRYKGLWEQAKKQGDKTAMDAIHRQAQALRDKYGIKEDLYSYEMLKNIPYEKLKILGYDKGGKIDYTGFAMVHGEKDPEWILRDHHLQKIISDSVLSTIKVATPKIPNITAGQGIILQIDNFIKADTITKDSIPELRKYENNAMSRLKNELNKFGVRPARV